MTYKQYMARIRRRDKKIIRLRAGGMGVKELGKMFQLTKQRISQIVNRK